MAVGVYTVGLLNQTGKSEATGLQVAGRLRRRGWLIGGTRGDGDGGELGRCGGAEWESGE